MCMERSMNRGKRSLEEEKSVTDLEERETNEERHNKFVNFCPLALAY